MKTNYLLGAVLTVLVLAVSVSAQSSAAGAPVPTATPVPVRTPVEFIDCDRFGAALSNKTKIKNQSEIKEVSLLNRTIFNNLGINAKKKKKAARRVLRRHRSR